MIVAAIRRWGPNAADRSVRTDDFEVLVFEAPVGFDPLAPPEAATEAAPGDKFWRVLIIFGVEKVEMNHPLGHEVNDTMSMVFYKSIVSYNTRSLPTPTSKPVRINFQLV